MKEKHKEILYTISRLGEEEVEFPSKEILGCIVNGDPLYSGGLSYQFANFLRVLEGQPPSYKNGASKDYSVLWAFRVVGKHLDYLTWLLEEENL